MAHTQGEWHAHDGQIYPLETGKTLALIPYFNKDNEEQKANANLIASAPDLLDACEHALKELNYLHNGQDSDAIEALRTAIDKATGGL